MVVTKPQPGTTRIFALANQKGGVGKSTCTYCLALALAELGRRVLVIDLDPQGNVSTALARDTLADDQATVADVLNPDPRSKTGKATHTLTEIIVDTVADNVDLAPGRIELSVAESNLQNVIGREHRLAEALVDVAGRYDVILIDCPPSLGQLTLNGLTAATDVLVVTEPEQWSADGISKLRDTIDRVRTYYNPQLAYAGVIINRFRKGIKLHQLGAAEIEQYFTEAPVLQPYVGLSIAVPEAIAAGVALDKHGSPTATTLAATFAGYAAAITTTK